MPVSDGLRILGDFWKKAVSWDLNLDESSWFLSWVRPVQLGLRDGTVSIVKIVSLSLCLKPKSKEGNKSFIPELKKSRQCFEIPMHVNVLHIGIFHISVSWICYTRTNFLYLWTEFLTICLWFSSLHHSLKTLFYEEILWEGKILNKKWNITTKPVVSISFIHFFHLF